MNQSLQLSEETNPKPGAMVWLLVFWLGCFASGFSQSGCGILLRGQILDQATETPLAFASIKMEPLGIGQVSDQAGVFEFRSLCPGNYHLSVSHVSCEGERMYLPLRSDTTLLIYLQHHEELLSEVVIEDQAGISTTQSSQTLSRQTIYRLANLSLGSMVEGLTGVSTLKTGTGISKPVIQGMYGNRISVLNNGIPQAGQQWGNDHAPEIDPLSADHISVVKGVGAISYPGSSLGGIVLVEPGEISSDPHLHGTAVYLFETNGLGHTTNFSLERGGQVFAWRAAGTWKRSGDRFAPDYFLTNTGVREANLSLEGQTDLSDNWSSTIYYSLFTSSIGILRGSHIGNLTDLQFAIQRDLEPYFTSDTFSFQMKAPFQHVAHHLLKWSNKLALSPATLLTFQYAGQWNARREFDVRRSNFADRPALSIRHLNHQGEGVLRHQLTSSAVLKTGLQASLTDNTNLPETGILPLIPDYLEYSAGLFAVFQMDWERVLGEVGLRYDWVRQEAATISRDLPRRIVRYNNQFHNPSASVGFKVDASEQTTVSWNTGFVTRNPAINERYSFGLHQGVSGIEEGDTTLSSEYSFKTSLGLNWKVNGQFFVEAEIYGQWVEDYIYLIPEDELRLTIRGAFPVFRYTSSDVSFLGIDVLTVWEPLSVWKLTAQGSWVRAQNESAGSPLIYIPPLNGTFTLTRSFGAWKGFENSEIYVGAMAAARQNRFDESLDFLPPPDGYVLLRAGASTGRRIGETMLSFFVRGDNLLNARYRNYLNRQRYFADEMGRTVIMGIGWEF